MMTIKIRNFHENVFCDVYDVYIVQLESKHLAGSRKVKNIFQ